MGCSNSPRPRPEIALNINSCFTSSKRKRCDDFRKQVANLLKCEEGGSLPCVAVASVATQAELSGTGSEVRVFEVRQMVTTNTTLKALFQMSLANISKAGDIRRLVRDVNRQWMRPKGVLIEYGYHPVFCPNMFLCEKVAEIFTTREQWIDTCEPSSRPLLQISFARKGKVSFHS